MALRPSNERLERLKDTIFNQFVVEANLILNGPLLSVYVHVEQTILARLVAVAGVVDLPGAAYHSR